jgi:hypothetical protein
MPPVQSGDLIEMAKGRVVTARLRRSLGRETADLSTPLRSVEKHFQEKTAKPQVPSTALRSGRDDKGEGWRFQEPFFITLGGPRAHDLSGQDDKWEGRYGPE